MIAQFGGVSLANTPIQLLASVTKGAAAAPALANADGSSSAFVIPTGQTLVVTDISIQRLSGVGTAELVDLSLQQNIPTGGTMNRWTFVGETTTNIERSFTTGIAFSTPFTVANSSVSTDVAVVRLWGYFL